MKCSHIFLLLFLTPLLIPALALPYEDDDGGDDTRIYQTRGDRGGKIEDMAGGFGAMMALAGNNRGNDKVDKIKAYTELVKFISDLQDKLANAIEKHGEDSNEATAISISLANLNVLAKELNTELTYKKPSAVGNFVTQSVTTSNWDEIRNVDFSGGTWSEMGENALQGLGRGVAIQTATSFGKRLGEGVDSAVGTVTTPFFSSIRDGFVRSYRIMFRQGLDPFDAYEITYWRDSVVTTLQLLVDSGRNLAEFEDRDRQQRQRDRIRGTDDEQPDESAEVTETTHAVDFAELLTQRCVVAELHRVAKYIRSRIAYYRRGRAGTHERQIIEAGEVIEKALITVRDEIIEKRSLKQLATPEFKAVIPHYITWIEGCFNGLGRLVSQDRKQTPSFSGSSRSNNQYGLYD